MPHYQRKNGTQYFVHPNTILGWWYSYVSKSESGTWLSKFVPRPPTDKYGYLPLIEVGPNKGKLIEDGSGRVVSPKFVDGLYDDGYVWNNRRGWFQREWTTWTPRRPDIVWETYWYDIDEDHWVYRIINPRKLSNLGGGGGPGGWCIWEEKIGKKE